jgi:hypothetical protein
MGVLVLRARGPGVHPSTAKTNDDGARFKLHPRAEDILGPKEPC